MVIRISIVTDEISQDFGPAVELGCGWGLTNFELRTVEFNRVPNIS